MKDRQLRLTPKVRQCVGCGARAQIGAKQRPTNVCAISPLLYRRGEGKGLLRTGARVCVCDGCLALFIQGTIDSRWMNIVTAIRESLSSLYNGVLEDQQA